MSFTIEERENFVIISIHQARATAELARDFKDFLFDLIDRKECRLMIINLSEVTFMDSFFLGAIVSGLKKIKSQGGEMRLVNLQPSLSPVFELMHLNEVFSIYPTLEQALEGH